MKFLNKVHGSETNSDFLVGYYQKYYELLYTAIKKTHPEFFKMFSHLPSPEKLKHDAESDAKKFDWK